MGADPLLPLFPLEVVLFPDGPLPLHIFEPRYRQMIGKAIEQGSEFGVILVAKGKLSAAGCTAVVERVTKRYPDGRFDIDTKGVRRFRAVSLDESQPYLQASVEYFDDEPGPPVDAAAVERVRQLTRELTRLIRADPTPALDPDSPQASFRIAQALPLDLSFKQQLLASLSEAERLDALAKHLETLIERLQQTRRVQKLAGGNGRAH